MAQEGQDVITFDPRKTNELGALREAYPAMKRQRDALLEALRNAVSLIEVKDRGWSPKTIGHVRSVRKEAMEAIAACEEGE